MPCSNRFANSSPMTASACGSVEEVWVITDWNRLTLGIIRIPATQIRTTSTRSAQGVRAIRMMKNEKIVDFALYLGEEDD